MLLWGAHNVGQQGEGPERVWGPGMPAGSEGLDGRGGEGRTIIQYNILFAPTLFELFSLVSRDESS